MSKSGNNKEEPAKTLLGSNLPLETETCVFILMNTLDVFMTFTLLYFEGFRESNAIANFFLQRWGIRGMVYFKFALVAFVTVIAQLSRAKKFEPRDSF